MARHDTHARRIAYRLHHRGLDPPAQRLDVGCRAREQPQRRQTLRELLRLTIELEHRLERGERHLVHTQRTLEVVAFDFFHELGAPDDDAGLRPAEELVAAEGHEIGAVRQRLLRGRFLRQSILTQIHQRAAAQVHHEWQPPGVRKRREFLLGHHRGETLDRVVAGVHLHEQRTARADGLLEIGEMGAIGGADLAQAAARARHDRGNAERSADFDELAARDDHLLARRERSEHQQYRGGVVVHHRGGLSAGEFGEQRFDMGVAVATHPGCELVLETARLRHDRPHSFDGLRRQQRAPEIGVQHCAGEVEHAPQRRLKRGLEASLEVSRESRRLPRFRGQRGTLQHGLAHFGE